MNWKEYEKDVRHLEWLRDIRDSYQKHIRLIENNGEDYRIGRITYAVRSCYTNFEVNSHRSISPIYIRDGLVAAVEGLNREIHEYEEKLAECTVTLD